MIAEMPLLIIINLLCGRCYRLKNFLFKLLGDFCNLWRLIEKE